MVLRDVCWLVLYGTFFPGLQQASTEFLNLLVLHAGFVCLLLQSLQTGFVPLEVPRSRTSSGIHVLAIVSFPCLFIYMCFVLVLPSNCWSWCWRIQLPIKK